jgi:hypothetical protein
MKSEIPDSDELRTNEPLSVELVEKREALSRRLRAIGRLMVAYSGGIDSAFLAYSAHRALGDEMLAVIADSPSLSRAHLRDAVEFAEQQGIPLQVVDTNELENPDYAKNDGSRCFHCKDELFKVMERVGGPLHFNSVAYGMNVDDRGDFRPGQKAAANHSVLAPLAEAGMTKEDIRTMARHANRLWVAGHARDAGVDRAGRRDIVCDGLSPGPREASWRTGAGRDCARRAASDVVALDVRRGERCAQAAWL